VDDEHDDVAQCLVAEREREGSAELLRLEQVERTENELVFAPPQVFVRVVDPLVRHHAEGEEDDEEDVRAAEHRLTPGGLAVDGAALADHDHEVRQEVGRKEGKEERLIHAGPSEDVDCDHATCVPFTVTTTSANTVPKPSLRPFRGLAPSCKSAVTDGRPSCVRANDGVCAAAISLATDMSRAMQSLGALR